MNRPIPTYTAGLLVALFTAYTVFLSHRILTPGGWLVSYIIFSVAVVAGFFFERRSRKGEEAARWPVLAVFAVVSALAFHETAGALMRSEEWLITSLFYRLDGVTLEGLERVSFFEIFGHMRFQPAAHLLLYLKFLLFGSSVFAYHALNIALHAVTGFLVYLVLLRFTAQWRLAYIFGLLFLVLPGQFDTVVWTYHTYIMAGLSSLLLSLLLAERYLYGGARSLLAAFAFSALAVLLYEASILAPLAVFLIIVARGRDAGALTCRRAAEAMIAAYAVYLAVTAYGITLTGEAQRQSMGAMADPELFARAAKTVFINLWESNFIKNIGVVPYLRIADIVNMIIPREIYREPMALVKILMGLLIVTQMRFSKGSRLVVVVLVGAALSYLFIISLGRLTTNEINYIVEQPRYQYYPNALLLMAAAILLGKKFLSHRAGPVITIFLAAFFFWNTQNVLFANRMVAASMESMNIHYVKVKEFVDKNPSARILVTSVPDTSDRFFLGKELALDIMFPENITKFTSKATHFYDRGVFTKNHLRGIVPEGAELGDFTIGWMQWYPEGVARGKDIVLVGSDESLPSLSFTPRGGVKVEMRNRESGAREVFGFDMPPLGGESSIIVEKAGRELCVFFNGKVVGRRTLTSSYDGWKDDGLDLLGDYYGGAGELFFVSRLLVIADRSLYNCAREGI